jgi:general secretion pathway protein I
MKIGCSSRRRRALNAVRGFTLLEVMVALAILSIALTSVYRLHSQTLTMSARARFYSQAPLLAQQKLSEIERQGVKNSQGGSGDFGQAYPHYTWTVQIEEMQSETLLKDRKYHLARIEVSVAQDEDETYHLRTYRFYVD